MTKENDTASKVKDSIKDASGTVAAMAKDAGESAKAQVAAKADAAKGNLADEIDTTASALRKAASDMRDGSPQGSTFSYLADGLADMAETVRGQDLSEVVTATGNFARRNPLAFLGGAALLGFAVTRFTKASAPAPQQVSVTRQPMPVTGGYQNG